jgi:hypothetical protein
VCIPRRDESVVERLKVGQVVGYDRATFGPDTLHELTVREAFELDPIALDRLYVLT